MEKLQPKTGRVLISDPFLKDPNFSRSVVLLTDYSDEGSIGFVLNNKIDLSLAGVLKDEKLPREFIFQGGPVELNTIHFLHSLGQVIPGSVYVERGIWWGGDFEAALQLIREDTSLMNQFHFYLGYSGWGGGQLEEELEEEAWLVAKITSDQIFKRQPQSKELWKELMEGLGGEYRFLSNSPIDPQLN